MKIELFRTVSGGKCTIGKLAIDGVFEAFTLEDVVREVKIPGKTAIPVGLYHVIVSMSQRFKRMLPLLLDVPNFEGVRIHPGNTDEDTEGCILVGMIVTPEKDRLLSSRIAFDRLFDKISTAYSNNQQITIEVK